MELRYFVYILASRYKGTLYIGVTNDLRRRLEQHRAGAVPGFTREYTVYRLVYFEEYASIIEARAREHGRPAQHHRQLRSIGRSTAGR